MPKMECVIGIDVLNLFAQHPKIIIAMIGGNHQPWLECAQCMFSSFQGIAFSPFNIHLDHINAQIIRANIIINGNERERGIRGSAGLNLVYFRSQSPLPI